MPAFGCNRFTIPFLEVILNKEVVVSGDGSEEDPFVYEKVGFRLDDRIVSSLDRLLNQVIARFASATYPGLSRFAFFYPFVGGVDWSHSLNLADEEGAYTKYSIIWNPGTGTITHNSTGLTMTTGATGSTQADCGWNSGEQLENWIYKTFGAYSRTNNASGGAIIGASKAQGGVTYAEQIYPRQSDGNAYYYHIYRSDNGGSIGQIAVADSLGLFMSSRENSLLLRCYKRAVQITYNNTVSTGGLGTGTGGAVMNLIGTRNLAFAFSTKHTCHLVYAEALAFADFVQKYQIGMARSV